MYGRHHGPYDSAYGGSHRSGTDPVRVIRASLAGTPRRPAPDSTLALVSDLIWAHAAPSQGLEHLRARASGEGMDVYLFLRSASEAAALDTACAILAGARSPLVSHGYRAAAPHHR
ncbi:hypothetical protein ACFYP6_13965 [Streptomyces goshikiensis]|uniref:hypothetical protein n=1 Tax=Streptomyces goshikiensis TaxID=1942 RepID=UPI0036B3A9FA